jgi:hypothetical protein
MRLLLALDCRLQGGPVSDLSSSHQACGKRLTSQTFAFQERIFPSWWLDLENGK